MLRWLMSSSWSNLFEMWRLENRLAPLDLCVTHRFTMSVNLIVSSCVLTVFPRMFWVLTGVSYAG